MKQTACYPRRSGFTLIELSIVLVIIGLIVGGILVGRDMIRAAELRSVMTEKEKFESSYNTFIGKYNCVPGDCANITQFFPSATAGNGNGKVDIGGEILAVFDHLQQAGLISGISNPMDTSTYTCNGTPAIFPGFNIPASKYPSVGYNFFNVGPPGGAGGCSLTVVAGNWFAPGQCGKSIIAFASPGPTASCQSSNRGYGIRPQPIFPCADIQSLDGKYDDGLPFTGSIQMPGTNLIGGNCHSIPGGDSGNYTLGTYTTNGTGVVVFVTSY